MVQVSIRVSGAAAVQKWASRLSSSGGFEFTFGAAKAEANARLRPSLNIVDFDGVDCSAEDVDEFESLDNNRGAVCLALFQFRFLVGEMTPR
jgi:hypothetical protein